MNNAERYDLVAGEIEGRIAMPKESAILLQETIREYGSPYIEIGTLYGGTAILAALMGVRVYAIDPMDGYNTTGNRDPINNLTPVRAILERNLDYFGVQISMFEHRHPPFPKALKDFSFGVGLIDGRHDLESALADYDALKGRCDCLVFDNTEVRGVAEVVEQAYSEGWILKSTVTAEIRPKQTVETRVLSK